MELALHTSVQRVGCFLPLRLTPHTKPLAQSTHLFSRDLLYVLSSKQDPSYISKNHFKVCYFGNSRSLCVGSDLEHPKMGSCGRGLTGTHLRGLPRPCRVSVVVSAASHRHFRPRVMLGSRAGTESEAGHRKPGARSI